MKRSIALILFPHAYIIFVLVSFAVYGASSAQNEQMSEIFSDIFTVGVPVCIITALVCTISLAISNVRSIQPYNAAKHNLLIKLLHIPAYFLY